MSNTNTTVKQLADIELSPTLEGLVKDAKELYQSRFSESSNDKSNREAYVSVAPGRVNLIGEHVDYTGGFVLPLAIEYCTVVYGTGKVVVVDENDDASLTSTCHIVSTKSSSTKETCTLTPMSKPPSSHDGNWTNYVLGVVAQYLPDLPTNAVLEMSIAISGNVPLGSGLSSSASLEVAVGTFVESLLGSSQAYSSSEDASNPEKYPKVRALRCQKAENVWCHSPCGIMDQYVSSAASQGALLLIDCTSFEFTKVYMKDKPDEKEEDKPVLVVTNSNVCHDIAGGEYPVRVAQCKTATTTLQSEFGGEEKIPSLRYATVEQVEEAKDKFPDEISYKRAKHVVTENERTLQCKDALEKGDWDQVGQFMNESHTSMKEDYEVSCEEIDILVELAQNHEGVYGSRLTGGGFGGCTVTLVKQSCSQGLMGYLKEQYKIKTNKECVCFETTASDGARLLAMDTMGENR